VPALVELMMNPQEDDELRAASASSLGFIGPRAAPAVPSLLLILDGHAQAEIQAQGGAAFALGMIQAEADLTIAALRHVLTDTSRPKLRAPAAVALSRFHSKANASVPEMAQALDVNDITDGDSAMHIQNQVLDALGEMGADATAAIPDIKAIAQNPMLSPYVRNAAKRALAKIGG
jgi:hypothetical protein